VGFKNLLENFASSPICHVILAAGIVESSQWLAREWMTGVRFKAGQTFFSSQRRVWLWDPPSFCSVVTWCSFPCVERPKLEGLSSSAAELYNTWVHTSTHPYVFPASCLVQHRHNFFFSYLVKLPAARGSGCVGALCTFRVCFGETNLVVI